MRLKWHQLKRRAADPPFARTNLLAGLTAGASLEVDLRRLACGRFVCLHDETLEGETTGRGPVAGIDSAEVALLRMLGGDESPMLLDELVEIVRTAPVAASARVQLDLKAGAAEIDEVTARGFKTVLDGLAPRFILSGDNWDAVSKLGRRIDGLALGYDPSTLVEQEPIDIAAHVRRVAPQADTIYLSRSLVRAAKARGDGLVARLQAQGHRIDCWTIDHGTQEAGVDMAAAVTAGCDEVTTNTPLAWASAELG